MPMLVVCPWPSCPYAVVAPALQDPAVQYGASEGGPRLSLSRSFPVPRSTPDRSSPISLDPSPYVVVLPMPELAVTVVPPALHGPVVEEGAECAWPVLSRPPSSGAQIHSAERKFAHLVGAVPDLSGVADPQLPVVVVPPALHGPVVEQGAGVVLAHRYFGGGAIGSQLHEGEVLDPISFSSPIGGWRCCRARAVRSRCAPSTSQAPVRTSHTRTCDFRSGIPPPRRRGSRRVSLAVRPRGLVAESSITRSVDAGDGPVGW